MENRDRESGWRRDRLGVMAPVSSGASWKEFFRISQDQYAVAANMFTRANLPADSWPYLSLATSIATYEVKLNVKGTEKLVRIIDPEHLIFCANMAGASVGAGGQGRNDALMAMTNIIAPAALSGVDHNGKGKESGTTRLDRHNKPVDEDNE